MISSIEARKITDEYNKNRLKILSIIRYIDDEIQKAANVGKYNVFFDTSHFVNISDEQMDSLISEIEEYGYKIAKKYEDDDCIQIYELKGYEISW